MSEEGTKISGWLAMLQTFTADGAVVDSEIIFKPECQVFIPKYGDYLANSQFDGIGPVVEEFGTDVAEKVMAGEIVRVERELPSDMEISNCSAQPLTVEKVTAGIRYPFPGGSKEYLFKKAGE